MVMPPNMPGLDFQFQGKEFVEPGSGIVGDAGEHIGEPGLRVDQRPLSADFVEKVEKSTLPKTRQIAIRWNIVAQHHLSPVADLTRCLIVKLVGPPANFLNAASIGLLEIAHR
jgi:hypothetical protein